MHAPKKKKWEIKFGCLKSFFRAYDGQIWVKYPLKIRLLELKCLRVK